MKKQQLTVTQVFRWSMLSGLFLLACWVINTIWYKPFNVNTFFERAFFEYSLAHPEDLTEHHAFEKFVFNDYARRLNDISLTNWKATRRQVRWNLEMLRSYKPSRLSEKERLSQEILDFYWEMNILLLYGDQDTYLHCNYPLDPYEGVHISFIDFMLNVHEINTLQDAENYLDRLRMGKAKIRQASDNLHFYAKPPSFILRKIILQIEDYLSAPLTENLFYQDFQLKVDRVSNMPEEAKSELHYELKQIIESELQPAYRSLLDELNNEYARRIEEETPDYSPSIMKVMSKNMESEDAMPIGETYYWGIAKFHMGRHYNEDKNFTAIARQVSNEIEVIRNEMLLLLDSAEIDASLGLQKGIEQLARRDSMLYDDGEYSHRQIFSDVKDLIIRGNKYAADLFGYQAEPIEIRQMATRRYPYTARFSYYQPSLDNYREARLFINLDSLHAMPKFTLPALVHHYTSPGAHFLKSVQHQSDDLPTFRRAIIEFDAYTEGWSFYAQRLLQEKGYYGSMHERIGHLRQELMMATALMADYYLHYEQWTYEETKAYAASTAGIHDWEADAIVSKAAVSPGKAYAFWEGYRVIAKLKRQAQARMLQKFDEYAFHRLILRNGPMPMGVLEKLVGNYIDVHAVVPADQVPAEEEEEEASPTFEEPSYIEE